MIYRIQVFITSLIGNFIDDTIMYIWKYYIFLYHELLHGYNFKSTWINVKDDQKKNAQHLCEF
jgi:hypothetical protein